MSDPTPIIVPIEALDEATIRRLVSEFVSREGTDYGVRETPMESKLQRALEALRRGDVVIVFDPVSQSTTLISKDDAPKSQPD
jgi:hypothetical protein